VRRACAVADPPSGSSRATLNAGGIGFVWGIGFVSGRWTGVRFVRSLREAVTQPDMPWARGGEKSEVEA
jgi:hypothetical protein